MPISPELAAQIELRLRECLADSTPDELNLREVVAKFGALPLALDWGGAFAIRPDGEIIMYLWDPPHDLRIEHDTRLRNIALFQGSLRYPELKVLVPARPDNAPECHSCKGTGIPPEVKKYGLQNLVCYCGGLGWLPPSE